MIILSRIPSYIQRMLTIIRICSIRKYPYLSEKYPIPLDRGAPALGSRVALLPDLRIFYPQKVDPDSERRRRVRRIKAAFHPQGLSCKSSLIPVHPGSDNGNPLRGGASEGGPPRRTSNLELSSDHRILVHPLQSRYILVQTKEILSEAGPQREVLRGGHPF
jgi:hypothetical protein